MVPKIEPSIVGYVVVWSCVSRVAPRGASQIGDKPYRWQVNSVTVIIYRQTMGMGIRCSCKTDARWLDGVYEIDGKKLIRRWDSEREHSLRRHRTRTSQQNTIDWCIDSATDRRGYVLELRFTKFSEINVRNATVITPFKVIQGHRFRYQSKAHTRLD